MYPRGPRNMFVYKIQSPPQTGCFCGSNFKYKWPTTNQASLQILGLWQRLQLR